MRSPRPSAPARPGRAIRTTRWRATAATTSITTASRLAYEPGDNRLSGRATISATATQDLSRFDLDLRGVHRGEASRWTGHPPAFSRDGQELVITPAAGIPDGSAFTVAVWYAGVARARRPDVGLEGWIPTDDGAFVACEPIRVAGLVSGQRRAGRQGDLRLRGHRAQGPDGDVPTGSCCGTGRRPARRPGAGARPTRCRRTSPPPRSAASTSPSTRSTASRPTWPSIRRCTKGQVLSKLPAIVRFFVDLYGEYPVQRRGRRSSTTPSSSTTRSRRRPSRSSTVMPERVDPRARDRAHVVRRFGDAHRLARDLAQRRVRHLVQLDLERGTRARRAPTQWFKQYYNMPAQGWIWGVADRGARQPGARCATGAACTCAGP